MFILILIYINSYINNSFQEQKMHSLRQLISKDVDLDRDLLVEYNIANTAELKAAAIQVGDSFEDPAIKGWFKKAFTRWFSRNNDYPHAQQLTAADLADDAPQYMIDGVNDANGLWNIPIDDNFNQFVQEIAEIIRNNEDIAGTPATGDTPAQPGSLARMTPTQVLQAGRDIAAKSTAAEDKEKAEREAAEAKEKAVAEQKVIPEEGVTVRMVFPDGWNIREFDKYELQPGERKAPDNAPGREAMRRESSILNHCIGSTASYGLSNYWGKIMSGEGRCFSLRDPSNEPVATLEVNGNDLMQIHGYNNSMDKFTYDIVQKIIKFVSSLVLNVTKTDYFRTMTRKFSIAYTTTASGLLLVPESLVGDFSGDLTIDDNTSKLKSFDAKKKQDIIGVEGQSLNITGDFVLHDIASHVGKRFVIRANPLIVHGDMDLVDVTVSLPKQIAIGKSADWSRAAIIKMPEFLRVEGDLHLPRMIKSAPERMEVKGTLFVPSTKRDLVNGYEGNVQLY